MQFVRAPDENVYIAPFNILEIVISGLLEWWMNKKTYEFINDCVMAVLYSPILLVAAFFETRTAHAIRINRSRGEEDDDQVHEWEQLAHEMDFEGSGWAKTCEMAKPNVEDEPAVIEVRKLRAELDDLKSMLSEMSKAIHAQAEQAQNQKTEAAPVIPETAPKVTSEVASEATPEAAPKAEFSDMPETPATLEALEFSDVLSTSEAAETTDAAEGSKTGGKKKKNKKKNKGGAAASGSGGPAE